MTRICPGCNSRLGSYDYYFCSSCGAKLPPQLVTAEGLHVRKVPYIEVIERKKGSTALTDTLSILGETRGVFSYLIIFLGIGSLVGIGLFFYTTLIKPTLPPKTNIPLADLDKAEEIILNNEETSDVQESDITESDSLGIFGSSEVYTYFPAEALLAGEFFGKEALNNWPPFMDSEQVELNSYVSHYGYILESFEIEDIPTVSFGTILFFEDAPDLEKINEIFSDTKYIVRELDNAIVVTDTIEMYDSIEGTKLGMKKSMGATPAFQNITSSLPTKGNGFMYWTVEDTEDVIDQIPLKYMELLEGKEQNYLIL